MPPELRFETFVGCFVVGIAVGTLAGAWLIGPPLGGLIGAVIGIAAMLILYVLFS